MIIRRVTIALLIICFALSFTGVVKADTSITDIYLYGPGGDGGTVTISGSGTSAVIGSNGGDTWTAQSFKPNAGNISAFTVTLGASVGSPTGTITYEIREFNDFGLPGTLLATGSFTPVASSVNTVSVSATFLSNLEYYWLILKSTVVQAGTAYWQWQASTTNPYADGMRAITTNSGGIWSMRTSDDQIMSITTAPGTDTSLFNNKIAQSFTVGGYVTATAIKLHLKKFNSPVGVITLNIESDTGNNPSGYLIDATATGTINEADLTTSYALTSFTLDEPVDLQPGIKYWIVIETDRTDSTDYVALGSTSDCVEDQYLKVHNQGVWKSEDTTGIFEFELETDPIQPSAAKTFMSLPSGKTAEIVLSASAGETAILVMLIVLVVIGFFLVFMKGLVRTQ